MGQIVHADSLDYLLETASGSFDLIYIDPPFNTGKTQSRSTIESVRSELGSRVGFGGNRYQSRVASELSYRDVFDDYLGFLEPRLIEAHRVLSPKGSLLFHIDYRESHYCKVLLDSIFGRDSFLNEIIWAYDYGGRSKRRWPTKHDTIYWYAKDPADYVFNFDAMDRIPYMAPDLVGQEKAARGKTPTDVWWQTIVGTNSYEKTGYPTQKPLALLQRIVKVHSPIGGRVLDFFAGSGTTGEAAALEGREATLVDSSDDAIRIMQRRLEKYGFELSSELALEK